MREPDFTMTFPAPDTVRSINDNRGPYQTAAFRRTWRQATYCHAVNWHNAEGLPHFDEPMTIRFRLPVKSNAKRDASNYTHTTKPAIDGMVDAGIFADDDTEHLLELSPEFYKPYFHQPRLVHVELWRGFVTP